VIGNTDGTTGSVNLTARLDVNSGDLRGVGVNVNSNSEVLILGQYGSHHRKCQFNSAARCKFTRFAGSGS
jgi:hypothetical protein